MSELFCIHGWGFSSKVFENLNCHGIDLPAHGKSKLTYKNFESLACDVAMRISKPSVLLGWSMGGSLAILIALKFPSKVKGLILIGTTPHFLSSWSEKNVRAFLIRLRREGEEFLRYFRKLAYPFAFEDSINLSVAYRMLEDYVKLDLTKLLPYITQRTVIVQGIDDEIVPFISGLTLYNLIKRSKFITFQGGHFPKRYERFIPEILKGF
ncbi:alpha/beta fold hydrolase [Hydrogenobacter thermophilus]|uniref:Putative biotin biosynthesis protein n=1 Tax=Hydrogenobacter thermophilus (strain DSM 6534 / IAM 12695 / TK-6) TaxID=608538 RepID=D3DKF1_HYDTT|nr:alpha/beta hydrolase [Hydrogenobacter thermophilus]BAI70303.1 putative biotin biosynthesis protein [Hydrogenobacter thermophilus TK-6]